MILSREAPIILAALAPHFVPLWSGRLGYAPTNLLPHHEADGSQDRFYRLLCRLYQPQLRYQSLAGGQGHVPSALRILLREQSQLSPGYQLLSPGARSRAPGRLYPTSDRDPCRPGRGIYPGYEATRESQRDLSGMHSTESEA